MIGSERTPLSQLSHFGVKGMRWGVRSAQQAANASYTSKMRADDRREHGKRAVARINARMNEGFSRQKALEREHIRNENQRLAAAGAVFAVGLIAQQGPTVVSSLSSFVNTRANQNRAASLGISNSASKTPFVKPRAGVHKITTMK